ncbi:uncharacterized protein METZ01_LOCUS294695, partial [marine metagenome]
VIHLRKHVEALQRAANRVGDDLCSDVSRVDTVPRIALRVVNVVVDATEHWCAVDDDSELPAPLVVDADARKLGIDLEHLRHQRLTNALG